MVLLLFFCMWLLKQIWVWFVYYLLSPLLLRCLFYHIFHYFRIWLFYDSTSSAVSVSFRFNLRVPYILPFVFAYFFCFITSCFTMLLEFHYEILIAILLLSLFLIQLFHRWFYTVTKTLVRGILMGLLCSSLRFFFEFWNIFPKGCETSYFDNVSNDKNNRNNNMQLESLTNLQKNWSRIVSEWWILLQKEVPLHTFSHSF